MTNKFSPGDLVRVSSNLDNLKKASKLVNKLRKKLQGQVVEIGTVSPNGEMCWVYDPEKGYYVTLYHYELELVYTL